MMIIIILLLPLLLLIIIIIITDREIDHRRPDITDHVKNNNKVLIIDNAVPSDSSVKGKEREGECLDFRERRQM